MQTIDTIKIDLGYLHSISDGDKSFEKILLKSAVLDIDKNIAVLKKAWLEENAVDAGTAAHTLKSVMTIAGMRQLEIFCKRIDVSFRDLIFHPEETMSFAAIIDGWHEAKPKLEAVIAGYD